MYSLEDELTKETKITLSSYLDKDDFKYQESSFAFAFEKVLKNIDIENPEHRILSMNYPYFRDDRFFPAFSIDLIKKFNPSVIITLIDDVFACWARISIREEESPSRSYFRIRDMFSWRSAAILFGDLFAKSLGVSNYVVSVKHPPKMLYKLIFRSNEYLRVYASYPITSTKKEASTRKVIDDFRNTLHEHFCVFDPVTIDDRLLSNASINGSNSVITKDIRWNLPSGFSMVSDDDIWSKKSQIEIPVEQIDEVAKPLSVNEKSTIDKHILFRDYRLISDSKAVIAGRPFFNKHPSQGVSSEIQYAVQTAGTPCYLFWNYAEDGKPSESPFGGKGLHFDNLENLISNVKKKLKNN